jgi:hypothetical protein
MYCGFISDFTPSLDGALVLGLSDEIEGEVADHGHVVSAVTDPEASEVLFKGDVENTTRFSMPQRLRTASAKAAARG